MKKLSAICLISLALLLLTFFVFLFLAIRPDPDDMIISLDVREHSLYYALKMRYLLSSFRTTLILSEASVLGRNDPNTYSANMFLYFSLSLLVFVGLIYQLIKKILRVTPTDRKGSLLLLCVSVTLAGSVYFLCSNRIEIFGWLGAAASHLAPIIFVLLSALVLFSARSSFLLDGFLLAISSFIIAGGAEHINAIVILSNIYLLYDAFGRKALRLGKKKILFFSIFHFVCCALIFTNPGVWLRMQDVNAAQSYGYDPGNFFTMFFQPYKLIGIALAFFSAFELKQYFKISVPVFPVKPILAIFLALFSVCFLMGLVAYHSYDIGRIWFPFDLFLVVMFLLIGLRIKMRVIAYSSLGIGLVLLVGLYTSRHVSALNEFRAGYDNIVEKVANAGAGQEVVIANFPQPDLVNLVELDADPNNELNALFCRFYGSKAKISVLKDHSKSR